MQRGLQRRLDLGSLQAACRRSDKSPPRHAPHLPPTPPRAARNCSAIDSRTIYFCIYCDRSGAKTICTRGAPLGAAGEACLDTMQARQARGALLISHCCALAHRRQIQAGHWRGRQWPSPSDHSPHQLLPLVPMPAGQAGRHSALRGLDTSRIFSHWPDLPRLGDGHGRLREPQASGGGSAWE